MPKMTGVERVRASVSFPLQKMLKNHVGVAQPVSTMGPGGAWIACSPEAFK